LTISKEFVPLKNRNKRSKGVIILPNIMRKTLGFVRTKKSIINKRYRGTTIIVWINRGDNIELAGIDEKRLRTNGVIIFRQQIRPYGGSFWYTVTEDLRSTLEFKIRKGKLVGFNEFVRRKHIVLEPVFGEKRRRR